MRTDSENHLRIDFGIIDLGVHAALGDRTLWVYSILRRYVWRSKSKGPSYLRKAYAEGKLVAKVSQRTIAEHLGLGRDTVNKAIKVLQSAAWIDKLGVPTDGDDLTYVLGRVSKEGKGYYEEFTADALCWELMNQVQDAMAEEGIESLHKIPLKRRVAITQHYFGLSKGKVIGDPYRKIRHLVSENQTPPVGKSDTLTGGVSEKSAYNKELLFIENLNRDQEIHNPSDCWTPEGSKGEEGEAKSDSPAFGKALLKRDPAPMTRRVMGESDGVPDHVVPEVASYEPPPIDHSPEERSARIKRARAGVPAAVEGWHKARGDKDRKRSMKDQKAYNLKGKGAAEDSPERRRLMRLLEKAWRRAFAVNFPDSPLAEWSGREKKQVLSLVEKYNGEIAEEGLLYVAKNWAVISERFKKAPQVPTPGWLLSLHDSLIPEASKFGKVVGVLEEWKAWWKEHPDDDPPASLENRFESHRKELESLGLI